MILYSIWYTVVGDWRSDRSDRSGTEDARVRMHVQDARYVERARRVSVTLLLGHSL